MHDEKPASTHSRQAEVASSPESHSAVKTFGYADDLLAELARQVIRQQQHRLPDLRQTIILLADLQQATRLRQQLLIHAQAQGFSALLGPQIDTFSNWIRRQTQQQLPVLSEHQRSLMLVEALIRHPYLYGEGNPWMLADSLLELFDEMNEVHFQPAESLQDFLLQISNAYGMADTGNESLAGEARLVHTLWRAWHQQMHEQGVIDRHADQLAKLNASLEHITNEQHFYLAGFRRFSPPQQHWLQALMKKNRLQVFIQGETPPHAINSYHPTDSCRQLASSLGQEIVFPPLAEDYSRFISLAYDSEAAPLQQRAKQAAEEFPRSPLASRLKIFPADSAEQEAQAVELQVRLWWLAGKRNIGIVTENRRLARRVRALLERAGIEIQDAAGWALSTTSAAATLERWLQTVEEDFAHQPLLDLLKSPFLLPGQDRDSLLATVFRFEQGIVLKENIARGLARYRQHTRYRQNRLPPELAAEYQPVHDLLELLAQAHAPLEQFISARKHSAADILAALQQSMQLLGLHDSLLNDAAGQRILEELQQMQAATADSSLRMSWNEFRTWLGRTLERFNFQPRIQAGQVQLMSLAQSGLSRFDGLIIAGAEHEYLPGSSGNSPFFNDGVRQALGLATRSELLAERFFDFRQLLESAEDILLTHRREQDGEDILPSPWLQRLQSFHRMAYADELLDPEFAQLVGHAETQLSDRRCQLPEPVPAQPRVRIEQGLIPAQFSASSYQQLIDCPYQFFAARSLKLSPAESIREMLEKSDYGERVHLCLQAFHDDLNGLPGPFRPGLTEHNQAQAHALLEEIGRAVFASDLEDNFLHRGWLQRWQDTIPRYVEWQLQRSSEWQIKTTEAHLSTPLSGTDITLRGRLDRLDCNQTGLAIIDYKTGRISPQVDADIIAGEAVQLPFYALLAEQALAEEIASAEYLPLEEKSLKLRGGLAKEELEEITHNNSMRLQQLVQDMAHGVPLPAWGDDITCAYCHMSGVCRRQTWQQGGCA